MKAEILNHLHDEMLVIYEEISRICDKHNLKYFVVGGTLLGSVVHKGFIPWDDDIDIAMPRDDYDKFIEICSAETTDKFYLHHTTTDDNYWLPFAKLRLNNTVFLEEKRKKVKAHAGIYVDIFPFDYSESCNGFIHKTKWRVMTWINNYVNKTVTGNYIWAKSEILLKFIFSCFSIKQLSLFRDKIMRSFDKGERKYFVDLAGGRRLDNSYFAIDDILPLQELSFGNLTVKAPKDPHRYLVQLYTEGYTIIPPKEKQITHKPLLIRFTDGSEYKYEDME